MEAAAALRGHRAEGEATESFGLIVWVIDFFVYTLIFPCILDNYSGCNCMTNEVAHQLPFDLPQVGVEWG